MSSQGPLRDRGAPGFHLIETLRREPGAGLIRGDLHLDRLRRSALELGFALERENLEAHLRALPPCAQPCRIRITLERDGAFSVTVHPFTPVAEGAVWTVRIAATRLDPTDPLLRHKISARTAYEAARAEFSPREADEVVLLNTRGEVCEGTITSIFARTGGGALVTPPLGCGLLDGVLRREMLASGRAREGRLTPADIEGAPELFVGNSLRGLIRARLVPA